MPPYIVTPWRSQTDLLTVRQQLYRLDGTTSDNRRHAVDRVMAWRLRGNLPHAVESTALLIDAFLHHDIAANSSFSVRTVYSAAFCRFVTGFCDIGRSRERSLEPSSMLEIARQIDMPADFVALRHEATHEDLPAQQRIVAACEAALQWLWRVYWSRLDMAKPEPVADAITGELLETCKAFAQKMFRSYRSAKRKSLERSDSRIALQQELAESVRSFAALCANDIEVLLVVCEDTVKGGLLIPKAGASLEGAFLVWDELLLGLCKSQQHFLPALVKALFDPMYAERQQGYDDEQRTAYTLWLEHICGSPRWQQSLGEQIHGVRRLVVRTCITQPSTWSEALSKKVLDAGDNEFAEEWRPFFSAANLVEAEDVEDLEQLPGGATDAVRVQSMLGGWQRAILSPVAPIGLVPE